MFKSRRQSGTLYREGRTRDARKGVISTKGHDVTVPSISRNKNKNKNKEDKNIPESVYDYIKKNHIFT